MLILAPLAMVFFLSFYDPPSVDVQPMFWLYAPLVLLSIFIVYTVSSITQVFISVATFGAMSASATPTSVT